LPRLSHNKLPLGHTRDPTRLKWLRSRVSYRGSSHISSRRENRSCRSSRASSPMSCHMRPRTSVRTHRLALTRPRRHTTMQPPHGHSLHGDRVSSCAYHLRLPSLRMCPSMSPVEAAHAPHQAHEYAVQQQVVQHDSLVALSQMADMAMHLEAQQQQEHQNQASDRLLSMLFPNAQPGSVRSPSPPMHASWHSELGSAPQHGGHCNTPQPTAAHCNNSVQYLLEALVREQQAEVVRELVYQHQQKQVETARGIIDELVRKAHAHDMAQAAAASRTFVAHAV